MYIETFLGQFAALASGPGGISKLRELVLQLAVQGKLVPQSNGEHFTNKEYKTAKSFVERIRSGKAKQPDFQNWTESVPLGWFVTSLGNVVELVNGRAFKPTDWAEDGLKIVRIQNLNNPIAPFNRFKGEVRERFLIDTGDVLVSWSGTPGTSFGAYIWSGGKAILNQHIFRADFDRSVLDPHYIRLAVNAIMTGLISDAVGSAGLQHVRRGQIENSLLKIPPLAEQKRIAAKVDELMRLCDRLQAQQVDENRLKRTGAASVLQCVSDAGTSEKVQEALHFLIANFKDFFDDVKNIEGLRHAILDLAYSGAFCDEKPKFVELEDVLSFGPRNGYSPKPVSYETSTRSISLSAVTKGTFDRTKYKYLHEDFDESSHLWIQPGDILIQRANSLDYVGMSVFYDGPPKEFIYPDLIMKIRVSDQMIPEYVVYCLQSPSGRRYFQGNATGTSGSMPKINQAVVKGTPIPFVNRKAQEATIEAVRGLMALCDQLDEQVRENERLNASLMNSLVHALTEADPDGGGTEGTPNESADIAPLGVASKTDKDGAGEQSGSQNASAARTSEADSLSPSASASEVDTKFKEAVLVGAIVQAFFEAGGQPIGNFRLQKAVYFARRHNGEHVGQMEYLKKAAGPYNPSMKYSGGIAIAKQKSWLRETRGRFGFGHVPGPAAEEMEAWFAKYGFGDPARWVAEHFRFKRNEEWETLATVDYAMEHLQSLGVEADATQVLQYIRGDDEWRPKIEKLRLTEMSVGTAMLEVKALFSAEGGDDSV